LVKKAFLEQVKIVEYLILMFFFNLVVLKGIIDFGDVCGSALVFDLSIAVLYHMVAVFTKTSSLESVYEPIRWLLSGYFKCRKLTEDEKNAVYFAVKARAAQSVLGNYACLNLL